MGRSGSARRRGPVQHVRASRCPFASLYQLSRKQIGQGVPSHWTPYLSTPDVDATAAKAADLGGQIIVPPHDVAAFARISLISDPTGALFGLWQAAADAQVTRRRCHMIDVTVVLLNDNYASTAIGPIEVFHSAGSLWNMLKGEAVGAALPRHDRLARWRGRHQPLSGADAAAGLHPQRQECRPDHRPFIGPGPRQPVRAPRRAASLAAQAGGAGRAHRRQLHRRGLPRRGRPPGWPRGDHALGHRRRVQPALSQGRLAAREAHHRGPAHAVQRRRLFVDGSQPVSGREILRPRGRPAMRQGLAHQHAAPLPVGLRRPAAVAASR